MTFQNKSFGILALGASVVVLAGCGYSGAMPSGYTYHHDTYKSATPHPSAKITAQQRQYMNAAQAEQFRTGVYTLLETITQRAGMPPKPVYVLAPEPMTTFYANIDNDLREGMRHIGYALSDSPVGAYVFAYDARSLTAPRGQISTGAPNVELVVKVFSALGDDARLLSEEVGRFYIQGAETLNIQPARYKLLPSYEQIQRQATGFKPHEEARTATQFTTLEIEAPKPAAFKPSPFERPVESAVSAPNTPQYGTKIGDRPLVNTQPLSTRSQVSRDIEY